MKGQRLFFREFDQADQEEISRFLGKESPGVPLPARGLLAKLVGDLAGVIALDFDREGTVSITSIVVAERLRRKRIGRALVEQTVLLAREQERASVTALAGACDGFLTRNGFDQIDGMLVRRV